MLFLEETYSEAEPLDWDSSLKGGRKQLCVSCPLTTNPINHVHLKTNQVPAGQEVFLGKVSHTLKVIQVSLSCESLIPETNGLET